MLNQFTCERCGALFLRPKRSYKPGYFRFCSNACRYTPAPGIPQPDGTILVPLSQGKFAIIDPEDAPTILAHNWYLAGHGYAGRSRKAGEPEGPQSIKMHRVIMGNPPLSLDIDHVNGVPLDNRRKNLRVATRSQNAAHGKTRVNNTSGYRGVSWNKPWRRWVAQICIKNRKITIGGFDDPIEAARAYDEAAREAFGGFAKTNF
jgi:AP2 domain/HNH endonuclease